MDMVTNMKREETNGISVNGGFVEFCNNKVYFVPDKKLWKVKQ